MAKARGRRAKAERAPQAKAPAPTESPGATRLDRGDVIALLVVCAATALVFAPLLGHGFLNWDDPDVLVHNAALDRPDVVAWAFTTTHMSHYQPLSWLAWAGLRPGLGPSARAHHLASLALHVLCALLVFAVARRFALQATEDRRVVRVAATVAALVFAFHPLCVEVVAWASALPYPLALVFLLLSFLAWWRSASTEARRDAWLWASVAAYAASLLSRPIALGFPLVLLAVDLALERPFWRALRKKVPFALLALAAGLLEGHARAFVGLERVGVGPRLSAALAAPFVYLGRWLLPIRLSPLDVLPLEARTSWPAILGGALGLVMCAVLAFRAWPRQRWLVAAGVSSLALLAPAVGLLPSGLQATADRYTYLASVPLALLAGAGVAAGVSRWGLRVAVPCFAALGLLGATAWRQAEWWRDSVTLWTRAVDIDPTNDVALYNLGLAKEEAGDVDGALASLRETLRLVPDHEPARRELASLELRGFERDAGRAAEAGRWDEAISLYTQALNRDGERMRSRASRGMALLQKGRLSEAAEDLAAARRLGNDEAAVASALSLCLAELGRGREAREVLQAGLLQHPEDVGLSHNLARLLATSDDREVRDGARALALAQAVEKATGGRDPRVYDTLAAAYAATGHSDLALEAARHGVALAQAKGDVALARALEARLRSLK